MRGGSELQMAHAQGNQTQGGLNKEYATAWSYGIEETPRIVYLLYSQLGKSRLTFVPAANIVANNTKQDVLMKAGKVLFLIAETN